MIMNDTTDLHHAVRVALLRAAQAWEAQGMLNSAIDAYSRLLRRHPGSVESQAAFERLLALGRLFEEQGHFHEALALFDKVEKLR